MKSIILSLMAALLIAGLMLNPYSVGTVAAAATCGDTYTIQKGDYLTKIAKNCGVTYSDLLKANPEIKDPNKVYPGQVIRIKAGATLPTTVDYVVVKGDTLGSIAARYGTTVAKIQELNPEIKDASKIYVGQKIKLPAKGSSGGTGGTIPTTGSSVSLSATSAKPGATVEVKVKGFPANAEVDFRLGKDGQAYSVVVDGKTNSSGEATAKVTIPSGAAAGEKWVVKVVTTDRIAAKESTSGKITIQ